MSIPEFAKKYQAGEILEPGLDEYFLHDRAVRESGHDTTYRFDGRCANLATIDLNSLTYKYAIDLEKLINTHCGGLIKFRVRRGTSDRHLKSFLEWRHLYQSAGVNQMIGNGGGWNSIWARGLFVTDPVQATDQAELKGTEHVQFQLDSDPKYFTVTLNAAMFGACAARQGEMIEKYLWDEKTSLYYDFDCSTMVRSVYKTCTALWSMWANICSKERAAKLVPAVLDNFLVVGGLVAGTEESRGHLSLSRPSRQWDFPYGWAPHQILAWKALQNYGFNKEAEELAYRWLYCITKAFVEYNGVVPEKFDVVNVSHLVDVEYGNVGVDFKLVAKEGFGWMNASYQVFFINIRLVYLS